MNKNYKRLIALVLSFSVLLSCLFTGLSLTAQAETTPLISDDFEAYNSALSLSDRWETIPLLSTGDAASVTAAVKTAGGKGIDGTTAMQNAYISDYNTGIRKFLNTVKQDYTPKGVLEEYSFYANTNDYYYDSHFAIVPYFNEQDDFLMFDFTLSGGVFTFRKMSPTKVSFAASEVSKNTEKTINPTDSTASDYDPWLKFTYRYEYKFSDSGCVITFHLDVSNSKTEIKDYLVYTLSGAKESFRVGFTADINKLRDNYFDNVKFNIKSYEDYANEFKVKYSSLLSKTNFSKSDIEEYSKASTGFEALPKKAKELLGNEKAKLASIRNTIVSTLNDDEKLSFSENVHKLAWDDIRVNSVEGNADRAKNAMITKAAIYSLDGGKAVFTPAVSDTYKSPIVSVPSEAAWKYKRLEAFEFDMLYQGGGFDYSPAFYPFIMNDKDSELFAHIGVQYQKDAAGQGSGFYMRDTNNSQTVQNNSSHFIHGDKTIDYNDWLHIKVEYNYAEYPSKLGITYIVTDKNDYSRTATKTYGINLTDISLEDRYFRVGFGTNNASGLASFKDIKFTFGSSQDDELVAFFVKHKDIIAKSAYDSSLDDAFIAMSEDFWGFGAAAKQEIISTGRLNNIISLAKAAAIADTAKDFLEDNKDLLSKTKITTADKKAVEDAYNAFEQLDAASMMLLYDEYLKLKTWLSELAIIRDDNDYSSFQIPFDDDINPFVQLNTPTTYSENKIVTDPTDSNNKVLRIGGKDDIFTLKYWPTFGVVKSVSFRMRQEGFTPFTKSWIFGSYEDESNYYAVCYGPAAANMTSYFSTSNNDGASISGQTNDTTNGRLDHTSWVNMNITFSDTSMLVTAKDEHNNSVSWSGRYARGGSFGFGYISSYNRPGMPFYIDDVNIEFYDYTGDFDINGKADKIDIYYSGNTFINPDESVPLTGNKLIKTTESNIAVYKVPEVDKAKLEDTTNPVKIVEQQDYSQNGDNTSSFAQTAQYSFNGDEAILVEATQRSGIAMTFTIPKELEKGIYAIKLDSKLEGGESVYRYINLPDVSFVQGNDGNIAYRGGTIRIIGSNMVPSGEKDDVTVRLINKVTGDGFNLPVAHIYKDDAYSLTVNIPDDFPYGDYEVFVHNGFGDESCWSQPSKITVAAAVQDSWNLENVFNVKDFGAVGDGIMDDTAEIISALDAAAVNGGTVYLPAGIYSVSATLAIPENVSLRGESNTTTGIDFTAHRWMYGNIAKALFSGIGNFEIRDLTVHGTRVLSLITVNPDKTHTDFYHDASRDNVYVRNVRFRLTPSAGSFSDGGGYGRPVEGLDKTSAELAVAAEMRPCVPFDFKAGTQNLHLEGVHYEYDGFYDKIRINGLLRIRGTQVQIRESSLPGYCLYSSAYGLIMEDNPQLHLNQSGNGYYMARNSLTGTMGNNRELMTTDGQARIRNVSIQYVGGREDLMKECFGTTTLDDTLYVLPNTGGSYAAKNYFLGYNLIVTGGQGQGQLRTIVESGGVQIEVNGKKQNRVYLKLDSPFSVEPNRKSTVSISEPRNQMYYVNNLFYEGAASGSYGIMIDSVWDGNRFGRHEGQYFQANFGVIWYASLINQKHYEPSYVHNTATNSPGTYGSMVTNRDHRSYISLQNSANPYSAIGFTIRKCSFDGYGLTLEAVMMEGFSGLIVEQNTFENREDNPIVLGNISLGSSIMLRDNVFETAGSYIFTYSVNESTQNGYGYNTVVIIQSGFDEAKLVLGDVNLDGKLSLKDATIIRFYLNGSYEFTEEQENRADVNTDSRITLKDISIIRYWLTVGGKDPDLDHVESDSVPDDTSSGESSDTSTDGSSSDNTSTDNGDINVSAPTYSGSDSGDSFDVSSSQTQSGGVTTSSSSDFVDADY